ncbi:MAG: Cytochrome O ubiquinol oxidase protein [uncultured bacterium]|nr:MAG: Cytochrome O ubiquinol oxidase protein [uncultured bacterium]OGT47522.1 MAG: cytochrome o ubiquinol oxidase subunit IV [Gammaproteobacteria bacterium RIFCSPHIGHO2_12_FULL_38_11]
MSYSQATHIEYKNGGKSLKAYITGFILSLLLTLAAFGAVTKHLVDDSNLYVLVPLLAIAQLCVQSICFLRLNLSREGRWNVLPFLFVLLIIAIVVSGSLWIMYNLDYNMMHF